MESDNDNKYDDRYGYEYTDNNGKYGNEYASYEEEEEIKTILSL
ncbi:MAG TPA: hypothetical protein VFR65_01115 [Nitrososphaeraceae archaeon]|nr:hypothetical protein [Nitrososphaeraceae archaeon]